MIDLLTVHPPSTSTLRFPDGNGRLRGLSREAPLLTQPVILGRPCDRQKTRQQAQNGIAYAELCVTTPRFDYNFGTPRNGILNQSIRNSPISTSQVMCLPDPCCPLKEGGLAVASLLVCLVQLPVPAPSCLYQLLREPYCLLHWILPDSN